MSQFLDNQKFILNKMTKIENDLQANKSSSSNAFRPIVTPRNPLLQSGQQNGTLFDSGVDEPHTKQQPPHLQNRLLKIEQEVKQTRLVTPKSVPTHKTERTGVNPSLMYSTMRDQDEPKIASRYC